MRGLESNLGVGDTGHPHDVGVHGCITVVDDIHKTLQFRLGLEGNSRRGTLPWVSYVLLSKAFDVVRRLNIVGGDVKDQLGRKLDGLGW